MKAGFGLFILTVALSPCLGAQPDKVHSKLQPRELVSTLSSNDDAILDFIVLGKPDGLKAAQDLMASKRGGAELLPSISGIGISVSFKTATLIAKRPDVNQIWYIPHSLYPTYCRIIQGLAYTTNTLPAPSLINMSLGPPADLLPMSPHDDEPISLATKKASDEGFIIVMAIGNYGDGDNGDNKGIVNPWCHPDWIICVGAASADAKQVWYGSARGKNSDPTTWPTVVADGIDVIGTWPTDMIKPDDRKTYDEANAQFREGIAKEKWSTYTLDSGTSEATPQVTRAAAQILVFVRGVAAQKKEVHANEPLFAIDVPRDRLSLTGRIGPRLTGDVNDSGDPKQVEIVYRLVQPWKLVKQLLIDSAVPMPGFPPSAVGAGFVDPNYIAQQFPTPEKLDVKIQSVKVQ